MGFNIGGAISGVFGGGGGGLIGSIGGMIGTAFGGPIGGMIGSAIGNAVGEAIGEGVKQGAKDSGMPKFLQDLVGKAVDSAVAGAHKNVDPKIADLVKNNSGVQDVLRQLTKDVAQGISEDTKGSNGGKGAQSWLVALAKAMGKVVGDKTQRLVELSNKINELPTNSKDPSVSNQMTQASMEMQGVSQELKIMQEAASTVIKGIGDALSSMARKQ
jgi:hypothetical protein